MGAKFNFLTRLSFGSQQFYIRDICALSVHEDVPKLNVPNINVEIFGSEYMFRISIVPNILYVTYNMILSISLYIILTFIKFGNF